MSTWLLSIAGIVIIGALVEVLLSESSIQKFVRSIYAFFVLFVIAQPLPGFFRDTVAAVETGGGIEINNELTQKINSQTAAAFEKNAQLALESAGYSGIIVTIDTDKQASFKIKAIYINALGSDINIKQDVIKIVRAVCNVGEEVIYYVG